MLGDVGCVGCEEAGVNLGEDVFDGFGFVGEEGGEVGFEGGHEGGEGGGLEVFYVGEG